MTRAPSFRGPSLRFPAVSPTVAWGLEHDEYSVISWGGTCKSLSATQGPPEGEGQLQTTPCPVIMDQGLRRGFTIQLSPLSPLSNGQARFMAMDRRPVLLAAKQFYMCDLCSSPGEIEPYFPSDKTGWRQQGAHPIARPETTAYSSWHPKLTEQETKQALGKCLWM